MAYNEAHGITPMTVKREITELVSDAIQEAIKSEANAKSQEGQITYTHGRKQKALKAAEEQTGYYTAEDIQKKILFYEKEMKLAAKEMRFEEAANARDLMRKWMQAAINDG